MVYSNRMMASVDVAESMPDANDNTQFSCFNNKRVYSTIPMNHVSLPVRAYPYGD